MRSKKCLLLVLAWLPLLAGAQVQPAGLRVAADSDSKPNIIKFNPYLLIHGYLPLAYERLLLDRLGAEIGGGPTTKDFFYHIFAGIDEGLDSNRGEFAEAKLGYGLYGALRLYLSERRDTPPAGLFLSMQMQHREHRWVQNYDLQITTTRGQIISRDNRRQLTDFLFLVGYQGIYAGGLAVELNGGLGIRNRIVERYRVDHAEAELVKDTPTKATLVFPLNIKVGYAF